MVKRINFFATENVEQNDYSGSETDIVGKNGTGKSTFLSCVCGLEKYCPRKIILDGHEYKGKKLAAKGSAVLVSTHDPELIKMCCDHILRIIDGKAKISRYNQDIH